MVSRLRSIEKFREDFTQSFKHWIQQFEAHLNVNRSEEDRFKDRAQHFPLLLQFYQKTQIQHMKHWRKLQGNRLVEIALWKLNFEIWDLQKDQRFRLLLWNYELCQIIKEIYSLTDQEAIKSVATSYMLSTIDRFMREDVRILQVSGNMSLETFKRVTRRGGGERFPLTFFENWKKLP